MQIAVKVDEVRAAVRAWKKAGLTVGLVPTMGYLHEGHASLVRRAAAECDRVVASVFVNPTQFSPNEDLAAYPRDFARDTKLLEENGCSLVFHPEPSELYAPDFDTWIVPGGPSKDLCGETRPIHFRGVCTVVGKLFNIVTPEKAYFGQKDAQQAAVIRRMVRDLNFGVEIVTCPIVREASGLAKSSRNTYLSDDEKKAALVLSKAVRLGESMVKAGEADTATILSAMVKTIEAEPLAKIDYVKAVDGITVTPVAKATEGTLFAMAVYIGKTRLIDNFIVGV